MNASQATYIQRRTVGFTIVLGLHALFFWVLFSDLGPRVIRAAESLQVNLMKEIIPEPEQPAPLPPKIVTLPVPTVKMPELIVEAPPEVSDTAITVANELPAPQAQGNANITLPHQDPRRPWAQPAFDRAGSVVLHLTVDEKGKIVAAQVAQSSGFKNIDDATVKQALRSWTLLPGTVDGKPVAMRIPWKVNFIIKPTPDPKTKTPQVAAKPASRSRNCLSIGDIEDMQAVSDQTIVARLKGNNYKRLDLGQCPGLTTSDGISTDAASKELCEQDAVVAAAPCLVEKITSLQYAEAAALIQPARTELQAASPQELAEQRKAIAQQIATVRAEQERPRTAIPFNPAAFDKFTGTYQLALDVFITVARTSDRFTYRLTGQPALEISPESETKFFGKTVPAQIGFFLDEQNRAVQLILYQDGQRHPARRVDPSLAGASEAALRERITARQPDPKREALLRQFLAGVEKDEVPTEILSPDLLASLTELGDAKPGQALLTLGQPPRWGPLRKIGENMGTLSLLRFRCVEKSPEFSARGEKSRRDVYQDVYLARYRNGELSFSVGPLTTDGKLHVLNMHDPRCDAADWIQ